MKTESSGKISSFAKYAAGLVLAFCKCADVGWQKSGWEKNKFWIGKSFLIIHFICVLVVLYDLTQSWSSIAYNGKSIGEVREFEGLKVQEFRNEADAFFGLLNYKNNQYGKAIGG